jgi:biopolymer transport protein ExbB/TolQ
MYRPALIALALIATTTAASAYDFGRRDRIDDRQAEQAWRIQQNRRHGNLTWLEKQRLLREQAQIRRMEADAKRDGYVSRGEYRRITEAQNEAARDIRRESHDRQKAWWRRLYW